MRLEETTISINYLGLMIRLCSEKGISEADLLKDSGIDSAILESSHDFVNGEQYYKVLENASKLLGDPTFGLYYGARTSITSHGILGFAFMSSKTLRDALILMTKYHRTLFTLIELQFEEDAKNAYLRINFTTNFKRFENLLAEGIIAGFYTIFQSMFNQDDDQKNEFYSNFLKTPAIVQFKQEEPEYSDFFYKILGKSVEFSKEYNQIVIPVYLLDYMLPESDPNTAKMAEKICQDILQSLEQRETYPEKVRKIIFSYKESLPTFDQVAEVLHLHPRTLGRRLKQYNTSYQVILDEVRKELALEYLADPDILIDDIAYSLRFNDASSFYRAFKKWTGRTPRSYRMLELEQEENKEQNLNEND
jgi:AraC-like DNA-binding protein